MQMKDAMRLQNNWGGKPCDHPAFDEEYFNGASTGDYVCTTCGRCIGRREYLEIEEQRKKERTP